MVGKDLTNYIFERIVLNMDEIKDVTMETEDVTTEEIGVVDTASDIVSEEDLLDNYSDEFGIAEAGIGFLAGIVVDRVATVLLKPMMDKAISKGKTALANFKEKLKDKKDKKDAAIEVEATDVDEAVEATPETDGNRTDEATCKDEEPKKKSKKK